MSSCTLAPEQQQTAGRAGLCGLTGFTLGLVTLEHNSHVVYNHGAELTTVLMPHRITFTWPHQTLHDIKVELHWSLQHVTGCAAAWVIAGKSAPATSTMSPGTSSAAGTTLSRPSRRTVADSASYAFSSSIALSALVSVITPTVAAARVSQHQQGVRFGDRQDGSQPSWQPLGAVSAALRHSAATLTLHLNNLPSSFEARSFSRTSATIEVATSPAVALKRMRMAQHLCSGAFTQGISARSLSGQGMGGAPLATKIRTMTPGSTKALQRQRLSSGPVAVHEV